MKAKLLFLLLFGCTSISVKSQTALNFDGVNDFVLGKNNTSLDLTQGTIEAWIKTDNAGSGYRGIVVKHESYGFYLLDNKLVAYQWSGDKYFSSSINLADGNWHHVVFSFNNGVTNGSKLYIDGNPVLTFTYTLNTNSLPIVVGAGHYRVSPPSQNFNGDIDQVRVWNYARTDNEISLNYDKCISGSKTGLVMLWNFEESTGTTATDLSGNNNNGALTNMDQVTDWITGYNCKPQNLVAYYPFNGIIYTNDESGNNHHGTVYGPTLTTDRFGNPDNAYHYHGNSNNDYIDIGDWENGGPMTINMWAKWEVFNNWGLIFDLSNGRNNDNIYIGNESTTNTFMFHTLDGATKYLFYCNDIAYPNRLLELNQWTMITCTVDEIGLMKAYKNGELIGTFNGFTPTRMVRTAQYFGSHTYPENGYFQGDLDDIRIYNSALTASEILNLYTYNTLKVEKIKDVAISTFYVNNNTLHFKNTQNLNEIKSVEVYNLLGQKVFKTSEITEQIELNTLQKGMYVLKTENTLGNYLTLKFLIN